MAYRVELARRAERDIEEAFEFIRSRAPLNALRWREGLQQRLRILETRPDAFGFAPENADSHNEVRQILFGVYRILYTIRGDVVFIIAVRHGARLHLTGEEINAAE